MHQITKLVIAGAAILALAACETDNLDTYNAAQSATPSGSAFDNALYAGYAQLANEEQNPYGDFTVDYPSRDTYSERALAAAGGNSPDPEAMGVRVIPESEVSTLSEARNRLVAALGAGAREKAPQAAATAQTMFDCWLEQLEENYQPQDIARCRDGFNSAMAQVDAALAPPPPPPPVAQESEPFLVFFDNDKSDITDDSASVIAAAAAQARETGATGIQVVGHTDTTGSAAHNMALSIRRAEAVRDALIANGVSANSITIEGRGQDDNLVPTEDGVAEPRNRRAQGVWIYQ